MNEVRVLAATEMLATGFKEESLVRGVTEFKADVIGCDSGSCDNGPYYLGAGVPISSRAAAKRDLRLMIREGLKAHIPVLVGSAGTAGGKPHVDWMVDIVREIAAEEGYHFKLAVIQSEISKEQLRSYMRAGRMSPLDPAPDFDETTLEKTERIVGVMGPEPFIEAMRAGADVVIAGRASDTSIYAAYPIMKGMDTGSAWHAAKILECGAGAVEQRIYPDCMMAWVREDSVSIEPPNPLMRCTPVSCLAHSLYENTDPFVLVEPGRVLQIKDAKYEAENDRRVNISNSRLEFSPRYTVKLEGALKAGYRAFALGGIRDPLILRQLDSFLDSSRATIMKKIEASTGLTKDDYRFQYRVYGNPRAEEPGEIGIVMETIADSPENAQSIIAIASHTFLHHPIKEWHGHQSQIAYPYSPIVVENGVVYNFCLNHVIEVDDPLELFPIRYEEL